MRGYLERLTVWWGLSTLFQLFSLFFFFLCAEEKIQLRSLLDETSVQPEEVQAECEVKLVCMFCFLCMSQLLLIWTIRKGVYVTFCPSTFRCYGIKVVTSKFRIKYHDILWPNTLILIWEWFTVMQTLKPQQKTTYHNIQKTTSLHLYNIRSPSLSQILQSLQQCLRLL